jgi:penicillin amidase
MELCIPANNQPEALMGLYPGYYLPEDRAKKNYQLLEPKSNWENLLVK